MRRAIRGGIERLGILVLAWRGVCGGFGAPAKPVPEPLVLVVMDPLAKELACACVKGHVPIVRPRLHECTAYGAAQLAALGIGLFRDRDALAAHWQAAASFTPQLTETQIETRRHDWQRAVERARGWAQ